MANAGRTTRGFTQRSRKAYAMLLDTYAIPFLGPEVKMAEVDRKLARGFVAHLAKQALSPASIKKCTVPLAAMFATAVEDGDLLANPFAGLRINSRHADEPTDECAPRR